MLYHRPPRNGWSLSALVQTVTNRAKTNILDSCDLFFTKPGMLSGEEIDSLRMLKEDGRCELRVLECKPVKRESEDEPISGLLKRRYRRYLDLAAMLDDYEQFQDTVRVPV